MVHKIRKGIKKINLHKFGLHKTGIHHIRPMLAYNIYDVSLLKSPEYIAEPKIDGTRLILYKRGNKVWLFNRRGIEYTKRFPEIVEEAKKNIKGDAILDGEIAYINPKTNKVEFTPIQRRCATHDPEKYIIVTEEDVEKYGVDKRFLGQYAKIKDVFKNVKYFVFDEPNSKGYDLRNLPLIERKKILEQDVKDGKYITKVKYKTKGKEEMFKKACKNLEEGIMLKNIHSPYVGTRSNYWLKAKCFNSDEAIVVGLTKGEGTRAKDFGALILAQYDSKGKLRYVGKTSGLTEEERRKFMEMSKKLKVKKSPLVERIEDERNVKTWLKPKTVVEVKFMRVSPRFKFRAPSFLRLRLDKSPKEIKWIGERKEEFKGVV